MENLLFTGGTGFLGKNVKPILSQQYNITTCGITPEDEIKADLAKDVPKLDKHYDIVLHACGKAHMTPHNKYEEQAFYDVNFKGTINLCTALEQVGPPNALIFISTVAVYGLECGQGITEDAPLNGTTPYAKSKILAEEYLTSWCNKHNVTLGIIRPSLLAGPNPPGNLGAMINGIRRGRYLTIDKGQAQKSILMVQDIAYLTPLLAAKGGVYNVCDTSHPSFHELENIIAQQVGKKTPYSIPMYIAKLLAKLGDLIGKKAPINTYKLNKIIKSLTFSNRKAREELGWEPINVLKNFKIGD